MLHIYFAALFVLWGQKPRDFCGRHRSKPEEVNKTQSKQTVQTHTAPKDRQLMAGRHFWGFPNTQNLWTVSPEQTHSAELLSAQCLALLTPCAPSLPRFCLDLVPSLQTRVCLALFMQKQESHLLLLSLCASLLCSIHCIPHQPATFDLCIWLWLGEQQWVQNKGQTSTVRKRYPLKA